MPSGGEEAEMMKVAKAMVRDDQCMNQPLAWGNKEEGMSFVMLPREEGQDLVMD